MPTWAEYKEIARDRGAFAMELFAVETVPAAPPEEMQKVLGEHLAYQKKMEAEGKLFLAGPLSDEAGAAMTGGGLIIYRAASLADAKALAEGDPMHSKGLRNFTVRAWLVNEGSLSVSVKLSERAVDLGL